MIEMWPRVDFNERESSVLVRFSASLLLIRIGGVQAIRTTMWKMQNRPIRAGDVVSGRSLQSTYQCLMFWTTDQIVIDCFVIRYSLTSIIKSDKFFMAFISRLSKKLVVLVNPEHLIITNYVRPVKMAFALTESDFFYYTLVIKSSFE